MIERPYDGCGRCLLGVRRLSRMKPHPTRHEHEERRPGSHPGQAEQAGHAPKALLQKAIAMRELDTAEDVNDVLVWRLRRLAQLSAHPDEATRRPQVGTGRATPPANRTGVRAAPPASVRPVAPDLRSRPPHR